MIDRSAGQQHDVDTRKKNANSIPNPEQVITSKRRKVRLKDILRNCVAEVNYPYVFILVFGLQEFLMHLLKKDELKTSIISNNEP